VSSPAASRPGLACGRDGSRAVARTLPAEEPVALVADGTTLAVMMASPADLEDFALGFALSEGLIATPGELREVEIVAQEAGIEARLWLAPGRAAALAERRRTMAGPVGCGLCGIDSLAAALRPLPRLAETGPLLSAAEAAAAPAALRARQPLHDRTRAVHAAGFVQPGRGVTLAREDVGRHNALDKLIGALARAGFDPREGAFVITSRVSVDMVQKTVTAGASVLIAVSAPTARAVDLAEAAGLTLAAFARDEGFDLYAHPGRIEGGASDVA